MTTANDRFTRVTDEYRAMREKLEAAAAELRRLKEQRAATLQSSRDAGQRWRQAFKDAAGKPGKEVRTLQAEERTLASEVEQLDELIDELRPHVEELRHWTGELRKQHVKALSAARREAAASRLEAALEAVFSKPEGQELLEALAQRADSLKAEVLEDSLFMGRLGFGGHEPMQHGFMGKITAEDRQLITKEVERRRQALVAEAVMQRMTSRKGDSDAATGELAKPLPPLHCEH